LRAFVEPEDFRVEEIPLYGPAGEGGHTFCLVEKRLRTTEEVARDLARAAGAGPRDVGYAGRKDRRAVTRQWFSVPRLDPAEALRLELPGARVLEASRHPHKLRTGQLRGNRFAVRLRGLEASEWAGLRAALAELEARGLPNRFGRQRFGRDRANAERGRDVLAGRLPARGRAARFFVSALQAELFNEVLARRPRPLSALEAGDLALRHASGGLFRVEDPAREQVRADAFEISATGPVIGTRAPLAEGQPGVREREVLAAFGLGAEPPRPPRGLRLRGSRRALRVRPRDLVLEAEAGDRALLRFALPPGSYASVLLEELVRALADAAPDGRAAGASVP
jgi:tRNA pseudouridine13 synthase